MTVPQPNTRVHRRRVPADRVLRLVADWEPGPDGATYCLEPGSTLPADREVPAAFVSAADHAESGVILFWSSQQSHLVIPPFPVVEPAVFEGWRPEPLRHLLERDRRVGVCLLRLSGFAVGIYENRTLVASKVGSRFVKGRHSKGGSSQARFARRRDEQARSLFHKACEVLRSQLDGMRSPLDHFVLGGDRRTLASFEKECDTLRRLSGIRMKRVLNVGDPKQATLETLPHLLYECVLLSATDDEREV